MKAINILCLCTWLGTSCQGSDPIEGEWILKSKFYKASCRIFKEEKFFKGIVLNYDDGTSFYQFDEQNPKYLFEHLQKNNIGYVDGITSATSTSNPPNKLNISMLSKDSLEMTIYILNQPINELWTRK